VSAWKLLYVMNVGAQRHLTDHSSNNFPSGVRHAMMMFRMSRTSLVSCSTRSVSSRTSMLTVMINTVLPSRASETLKLQSSPAETVSCTSQCITTFTNHVPRQAKDHRPNRSAKVQRSKLSQDRRSRAGACPC
jgi:hypothetical protein